jgi:hypothetical protein
VLLHDGWLYGTTWLPVDVAHTSNAGTSANAERCSAAGLLVSCLRQARQRECDHSPEQQRNDQACFRPHEASAVED